MPVKKVDIKQIASHMTDDIDVFICCSSFESRCLSIINTLDEKRIKEVYVTQNANLFKYTDKITENTNFLSEKFEGKITVKNLNTSEPITTADTLFDIFNSIIEEVSPPELKDILIDITTFTHESLLILIQILRIYSPKLGKILLVYIGAKRYSTDVEKDEDKWLSKGVREVRSILGYPGVLLPTKPTNLIVLVGFEGERASKLIESYECEMVTLGCGISGTETAARHHGANEHFENLVKESIFKYAGVSEFKFSCNDPLNAMNSILHAIQDTPDYNHIIAPMNTKLSSIGAALVAIQNEKIQLSYTQPLQYNYDHYSEPGQNCYIVDFKELLNNNGS